MLYLVIENEQPHSSNSLEDAATLFISLGCKQLSIHKGYYIVARDEFYVWVAKTIYWYCSCHENIKVFELTCKVLYVIFQKRVRVLHRGFQTWENWWKHEAVGRVLLLFSSVWKPRWNTKHDFLKLLLQQKKMSLNYHLNKFFKFKYVKMWF